MARNYGEWHQDMGHKMMNNTINEILPVVYIYGKW